MGASRTIVLCPHCGMGFQMDCLGMFVWCPFCMTVVGGG